MPPLSILDLAFVPEGGTPADALRNTLDLAQHAEKWGYRRFWLAEHHNMVGIASAATAVVISYVAAGHEHDPGRRGRDHAAESFAAPDRGTVRHSGITLSGKNRPRTWTSAGNGINAPCGRCGATQ